MDDPAEPAGGETALSGGFVNGHDAANFERCRQLLLGCVGAVVIGCFADDFELRLGKLKFAASVILLDFAV